MSSLSVAPATRVTLHFSLGLDSGELVDSTFDGKPATFKVGDGNLLPGFERRLFGLQAGQRCEFRIPPEDAFGQPNPANVQRFARSLFAGTELAEGLVISFADAQQSELPGVVKAFDDDEVVVDFNHPLAGLTLLFTVEIVDVQPAQM
jgi:FKBP-type peptidyl-prolyl cis-trans isomerase SlpA